MKVYLRHAKTGSYYSGYRCWTEDSVRAVNFESPEHAIQRARQEQMSHVEMVLQEGDLDKETVIPVTQPVSL